MTLRCLVLVLAIPLSADAWTWPSRTRTPTRVSVATRTPTATPARMPSRTPSATVRPFGPSATPTSTAYRMCGYPPQIVRGSLAMARPDLGPLYLAVRACLAASEYPMPPREPTPGWDRIWVDESTLWLHEMPAVDCPQTPGLRCCIDALAPWWDGRTWRKAKAVAIDNCFGKHIVLQPTECRWADGRLGPGANTLFGHELQHLLSAEWTQYGRPPALHESNWQAECEIPPGYMGVLYYG